MSAVAWVLCGVIATPIVTLLAGVLVLAVRQWKVRKQPVVDPDPKTLTLPQVRLRERDE